MADVNWVAIGNVIVGPGTGTPGSVPVFVTETTIGASIASITPEGDLSGIATLAAGDIVIADSTISSVMSDANIEFTPLGTGIVLSNSDIQTQTAFKMKDPGVGLNTVTIQSQTALPASYTLIFPPDEGTANQALVTDGAGNLSWATFVVGNVIGSGATTDNAVTRWNGITGLIIQNSGVILDDSDNLTGITSLTAGNIHLAANTVSTTDTNGNLILSPNGSGITTSSNSIKTQTALILEDPGAGTNTWTIQSPTLAADYALTLPTTAGSSGQVFTTNGSGVISWTTPTTGTITGPGSSTDTAIVRWNGTTGLVIENSTVTIDSGGIINTNAAQLQFSSSAVIKTVVADKNVSLGQLAMPTPTSTTGASNTALGYNAGNATTSGAKNVYVGVDAGKTGTTANNNTCVGQGTDVASGTAYSIVLGSGAVATASNTLVIGSSTGGQGITTTTTGGTTNGTATALTLLPLGYLPIRLNGTVVNFPYYSTT